MKQNTQFLHTLIIFLFCCSVHQYASAQQTERQGIPENNSQPKKEAVYSFRLYQAPENAFGYDILKDGKPVFHQFAIQLVTKEGKRISATKPQVESAAKLAIEKVKKGEPALLSLKEIQKSMVIIN